MNKIFPEKRKKGYVVIEYTGYKQSGTARRIWPKALVAPRKPMMFASYKEANDYILSQITVNEPNR